ncbi:Exostosin family [Musa troglodytarum]|uniref:Exostosin family n=1 Tax=Musa troglodytarum TaxID=320322 RepID=A0A9E7HWR5_9LILI|nr:Exostosin family [Musa troglodytarum]
MAGKPQPSAFAPACSIRRSLLAVAVLALICFALLSLRSLRSPPQFSSPKMAVAEVTRDVASPGLSSSSIYHSPEVFFKSYAEMEGKFKVFIYPDGDPNTYFQTPRKLTGKYASEGYFFQNIRESRFRTEDPDQAGFSVEKMQCKEKGVVDNRLDQVVQETKDGEKKILVAVMGTSYENMTMIVQNYVESLIGKYPYWNRTLGADHFFVTCHDVGVRAFEGLQMVIKNSIRVVCSPSYDVGYIPHKDVALPQVLQPFALPSGGNDIENRTILGFWAGHRNSKIRVILARVWENDTELAISNNRISRAIGELVYQKQFYRTKFCICPGGSQKFSVILKESDVYQLKSILKSIPHEKFSELHKHLVEVQKHFEWHSPPAPYDAFHMVMYELWLRHHEKRRISFMFLF